MEQIGIRELNQNTSHVLARVRHGEAFEVTERGRPVAHLTPIDGGLSFLDRLVAQGRITASTATGPIPLPPVLGDPDVNVGDELAALRDEERW